MTNKTRTIGVIGAGIVGTSCALWLQKKGFPVILIDAESPGTGTSSGNACTIADYACVPVNSPDIFKRLPGLLFSRSSPLTVSPAYALTHLPWLLQFLSHCRPQQVARISQILGDLLLKTYEGLTPLLEYSNAQSLISRQGCMYVYRTQREFDNARASNQVRKEQGCFFNELDACDIRDLEPGITMGFEKGLLFDRASHVLNPLSLTTAYIDCFLANRGRFVKQKAVSVSDQGTMVTINLGNGESLRCDQLVIAAGAFSRDINGSGAEALPLDTERGYHVQYAGEQSRLNRPVCWSQAGIYATPMNQGLRFAGTVEIAGYSGTMNQANLDYLTRRAQDMFGIGQTPQQTWLGFRPTLPDALPVIGYSPRTENILFAFGHQHIGLTLSGITGKLIAELINRETPSHDLEPFSPGRFSLSIS